MGKDIVKYRYAILIIFIVLIVVALVFFPQMINTVNYDLTSYLPEGYDTYDGYQFLSEHFNIHGDVEIGVYGTYEEVEQIVSGIENDIEGITGVTWADMLSYLIDLGIYERDDETFAALRSVLTDAPLDNDGLKHNWAVLVTIKYPPSSPEAINVFQAIKAKLAEIAGSENFSMSGMTEQANALFETVFDEMWLYCLIAGIVVLFILALTTNSLMEPLILLLTLGISIILNLGTNAIFPSTSIITFACTAILQLGLSMDYAIFLLHQYRHELKLTLDPKEALARAIPKSAKAIAASALTTIGGFLALLCMKFGVGSDLGLSLAKGIVFSLLTVVFLQPCLMLMCEKARVHTQHKCVDVKFKTPVKHSIKNRGLLAIAFVILLIPMFFASNSLSYAYLKFLPDNGDTSDKAVLAKTLGNQVMIIVPTEERDESDEVIGNLDDENYEFVRRVEALGKEKISFMLGFYVMLPEGTMIKGDTLIEYCETSGIELDDFVKNLLNGQEFSINQLLGMMDAFGSLLPEGLDLSAINSYMADGYTMYTVGINPEISNESPESFAILEEIKAIANEIFGDYGKCYFTGVTQAAYDFAAITPSDFLLVTIVSVSIILIILMLALRSVKFPVLLVALIEFGIWINLAMQYIFTGGTINFMSYLVISAVQLGATVDYAILVTNKYRELRKRFAPRQAAYTATTSSAMTIVTSALIMSGACFSVFGVSTNLVIKEMTFLMARGALISAALVIFLLPALLTAVDRARGGELHTPRTPKLRKYRIPSKAVRASWKESPFGEIALAQQSFSGDELYYMMHKGVDINSMSDKQLKRWLNKNG